jgi:EAL domain-containing protein (putative c-di-GMP-specific phosphodiesterase class I)
MRTNPIVVNELKRIASKNKGILKPEEVVKAAEPAKSPLHSYFCWNDTKAAQEYRIWQARMLIRTTVQTLEVNGNKELIRVFVSLKPDREFEGGGYRETLAVISNLKFRAQLLQDAYEEMKVFQDKYSGLRELASVMRAIKGVLKRKCRG